MSKSAGNTFTFRDPSNEVTTKLKRMLTDRNHAGEPTKCPVWRLHQVYSDENQLSCIREGSRSAGIGCLDCKKPLIDAILAELSSIQREIRELESNIDVVKNIIVEGSEKARDEAQDTLKVVKEAIGLDYR